MKNCLYFFLVNTFFVGIVALLLAGNAAAVNTHIQTDGTLPGAAALNISAPGANHLYTLSEINGKLSGHNLFYSFSNFSIGTTDTAWFNLHTPDLASVISRVTGGSESLIDGKLQMTNVGSTPSFYFINPAGITFSSGASIDVPGSFYVSTASNLNFSDGSQYAANEASASSLSSANPESFGFLGNEVGSINIGDANPTNLTFKPGTAAVFSGNDIHINNAAIRNEAFSKAGLDLQFFAIGSEAVNLKSDMLVEKVTAGDLYITNSLLDASGNGSGRIITSSRNLFSSNSDFWVVNTADLSMKNNQGINLYADSINLQQTSLFSYAIAKGRGSNINILTNLITANTGVEIVSETAASGVAGNVIITANTFNLENGSAVRSKTTSQGTSGGILINTKSLEINKSNITNTTTGGGDTGNIAINTDSLLMNDGSGIVLFTSANGNVGALTIDSKLVAIDKGFIASKTIGNGKAGDINISTDFLKMSYSGEIDPDFKNGIDAGTFSNGDGGNVTVNAEQIEMTHGFIGTSTGGKDIAGNIIGGEGAAGDVFLKANSLVLIDAAIVSNTLSQGAGGFVFIDANNFRMIDSSITSDALSRGNSGSVNLSASSMWLDSGSRISSSTIEKGNAGQISIDTNELTVTNDSIIQSETFGEGKAGSININSDIFNLNSGGFVTSSSKENATGLGGSVVINTEHLEMDNGKIGSDALGEGDAGSVTVTSDSLSLKSRSGITSTTIADFATSHAGLITVTAKHIEIDNSLILSTALNNGHAGSVSLTADSLRLSHGSIIDSSARSSGDAGSVIANVGQLEIDDASISTGTSGGGNAGNVTITADSLKLSGNGEIESNSFKGAEGNGGIIAINTGRLEINDGRIASNTFTEKNAGSVTVTSNAIKLTNGGIVSGSLAGGNAGSLTINTKSLEMNQAFISGDAYGNGNAGKIDVNGDTLQLRQNSFISTNTFGLGHAGNISITSNNLIAEGTGISSTEDLISLERTGIFSGAGTESSGQTGTININSKNAIHLNNGAQISIKNDAIVAETQLASLMPTAINIDTANLFLKDSRVAADSNGNVDAGNINIHFADQLFLDPSQISTEAASGNGGSITIQGNGVVFLLDSAITTSVSGQSGNGGNIAIAANGLILNSGFIQANTAASGASGGKVDIQTPALIPSGSSLFVGGNIPLQFQPFSGLNVIQAAAPDGVSGTINMVTPQLNLNAMMTNLVIESFDSNALNRDMCSVSDSSSLMQSGRGAQPLRARDLLLSPMF